MQHSITFELLESGKRLSKPADALHRHRFKLIEAAGRGEATHGALAQESHENIVIAIASSYSRLLIASRKMR